MKLAALLAPFALLASLSAQTAIPITLDHNRVILDVRFPMPDGTTTRVRAWLNNSAQEITITDHMARKLNLAIAGSMATLPSELHIGATILSLPTIKQARVVPTSSVAPGLSPEIILPGPLFKDLDLLIDYPNREFTVAARGSIQFKGTAVKATMENGEIHLPSEFAGEKQDLTLDLGSSFTELPSSVIARLSHAHPQWPQTKGAISTANQWGSDQEGQATLLRVPMLNIGEVSEKNVAVSSAMKNTGMLGANALLAYRIGIDSAHSTVYFDRVSTTPVPQMDVVGLTLRPQDDGKYVVAGISDWNGKPSEPNVKAGDMLVKIDGIDVAGGTMGQAWSLLGGAPGDVRELTLERDGKRFTAKATVHRFLETAQN
jgi:hypothetical protein